jgi:uncharacterized protein (UPF0335 family)
LLADRSRPDGISGDRLRSFVECIERIDEDIKATNDKKNDIFAEAKGEGFDTPSPRKNAQFTSQIQAIAANRENALGTRRCTDLSSYRCG